MTRNTSSEEQAFLEALNKKLWNSADRLRASLDAAVYKHAVLGLIFLKYVSDAFDLRREELRALFIDARQLGFMKDRVLRDFAKADLDKISGTFRSWKRGKGYADVKGFCRSASCQEIAGHGYVLTPGRYVGAEDVKDDGEPFDQKMRRLVTTLHQQFAEGAKLEKAIRKNLAGLGFGGES